MTPAFREEYKALLRRQREVNRDYETLLERYTESDEGATHLPPGLGWPSRPIYVSRRCALDRDGAGNLGLMTLPGQRSIGLKELRDFTVEAEDLIVIDPYVFSGHRGSAEQIATDFKKTARVAGKWLKKIHFVYDKEKVTNAVKNEIQQILLENSVKSSESQTSEIHDRIWIADRSRALVVGTSFNGLGGRAAFLLPLPDPDLKSLLEYLDEKSLSRAEA